MNHTETYAIVVAHPDDEILFASSIIKNAAQVFICFSDVKIEQEIHTLLNRGRKNIEKKYPLGNVNFLGLTQASNKNSKKINWENVTETIYGVKGGRNEEEYKKNFNTMYSYLFSELGKFDRVYTHNPWGEYGHVEHIQVYRCVSKLRDLIGFQMYVFGYLSFNTINFTNFKLKNLCSFSLKSKNNLELFHRVKNLYIKEKCWTWSHNYSPPEFEFFYEDKSSKILSKNKKSNLFILNYIYYPIFSKSVRCYEVNINNIFMKMFMIQNKYFFKLRVFVLEVLRSFFHSLKGFYLK